MKLSSLMNGSYSHDLSLQNTSTPNPAAQHPQKKQHSSRYEGSVGKLNGRISAMAKASDPYRFIVGCTNNCYQVGCLFFPLILVV